MKTIESESEFILPDTWTVKRLSDPHFAITTSGGTPSRSNPSYFAGKIPWVKSGELEDGVIQSTEEHLSETGLANSSAKLLRPKTVLIALYGATVGKTAILDIEATTNQAVCAIIPVADSFVPRFLQYRLMEMRPTLLRERHGGAQPNISQTLLKSLSLLIPPQLEQKKIAAVLWRIQQAIDVETKLACNARDLKKATMRQLFTTGLRDDVQKLTSYGEVPDSWKIEPLSSCAYVQTGATKGRLIPDNDALKVPYLRVANVQDGHLDLSEMKTIRIRKHELDGLLLRRDDVVLTEGGDFDKLGRGFIWEGQIDPCVHQNHIFAVRVDREKLLPRYFAYLAQSPYGRAYFLSVAHKTTNLACINTTKLRAFPVLIPELDEQKEISEILETIDRKIALHDAKQSALQDLFKTMLHKLMTAQIRVNGLEIDTREIEA
jgi:type I restriction enzyme, S subunit